MKKNIPAVICATILIGVFLASSCFALEFGARANYWIPTFKGDLRVDKNSVRGTEIDLKDDLGVKNENVSFVEAYFGVGKHEITFMYAQVNFSGTKYFDGNVRLHSSTIGSAYDNTQDIHAPIPMIGLGAKIGLLANILEARAKIIGMGYSGSFFYDAMADVAVTPFPFFDIHAGYRAMSLKIDNISDVYANMSFTGPYIGVAIGF